MDSNAETIISLHPGESVMFSPQPGHSIQAHQERKKAPSSENDLMLNYKHAFQQK